MTHFHAAESTGIPDIQVPYSKEKYARLIVWCLYVLLDGWPWHIPFANLSDIKCGAAPLRFLVDLLRDGTLRFIPAPEHVWRRALHDTNKARHRPVSNPEGRPMRARKVGVLTSPFVLDRPAGPHAGPSTLPQSRPMKPLSEHRLQLLVGDRLGSYVVPGRDESEVEDIDSDSDSEDSETESGPQAKRRRFL